MAANSAYPWQPTYGCGLPQKIGEAEPSAMAIQADVLGQMLPEASVAPSPLPTVAATPIPGGGMTLGIVYTDAAGTNRNFSFDIA